MIDLSPIDLIPLIQLWATISVLFFYQPFFRKHPLEPQLDKLNKSLEQFYELLQGYINEDISSYISVKWDQFFLSIKRMTASVFFYSLFLLFYLGLLKEKQSVGLYHSKDIFFLASTNVLMIFWVLWHPSKAALKKLWKRTIRKEFNDFFYTTNNSSKDKPDNIKLINIYFTVFVIFFLLLFLYFFLFEPIDSFFVNKGFYHWFYGVDSPVARTIVTGLTIFAFLCVPLVIYIRIQFDKREIKKIEKILFIVEDVTFLNDISSMPITKMNELLSKNAPGSVSRWRDDILLKKNSMIIEKEDIRNFVISNSEKITLTLKKSFLDITYENDKPIKGIKFTTNQQLQLDKILKNQLDSFYDRCKNSYTPNPNIRKPVQPNVPNTSSTIRISEITARLKEIIQDP